MIYGRRPNELMVKRLGMMGCSALVLVNSIKDNKKLSSYAGELLFFDLNWNVTAAAEQSNTCFCASQALCSIKMIMDQGTENLFSCW